MRIAILSTVIFAFFVVLAVFAIFTTFWLLFAFGGSGYNRIASVDCGKGRTIHIYEEAFCDNATIPVYDVEIDGRAASPKFSTGLWYECGNRPEFDSIRTVSDDSNNLVAVIRGENELIAIYDFDKQQNVEQPSSGRLADLPREILDRVIFENMVEN